MWLCLTDLPAADREKWEAFISGQLADTNKRNTVDLVSEAVGSAPRTSAALHLSLVKHW